ncbi:acyl carrier protein [Streptomyces sp. NPDC002574]|uniref:acyl carrier protein n=1 Tax=Streptomyces sp. NPDC002574 TaxID=3364652 RepID=UPI0036B30681
MTHDVAQIVRRVVAECAGVPEDEVRPEVTFSGLRLGDRGKQRAADAVERKVGVMLLADEVERMGTVGDLVDTVSEKLSEQLSSG